MKALITCSGLSNTGRLTTHVAMTLMSRRASTIAWAQAHKGVHAIANAVDDADQIIVIEGCSDHCALKKLDTMGITADLHIVATDFGVEKDGLADVKWRDVEKVLAAVDRKMTGV
jgi:uncharacterized metal-binding protein